MRPLLLALGACAPDPAPVGVVGRPVAHPADPPAPDPTGPPTPVATVPRVVGAECDPEVVVPGTSRSATPHADDLGRSPAPVHVRIGWPSSDPSTSASFVWSTDADTVATVVEYGVGARLDGRVYGASWRFGSDRIHEVKLCTGLVPGTTYRYRVGGDGAWSDFATFTVPGPPGTFDTFRIAVAGDSRGGEEVFGHLLAAIDAEEPDFVLFTGDFVHDGDDPGQWDEIFEAAGDVLARRVLVPAHGNHERLAPGYFGQFSLPGNEQWFSYVYGDLQLVVLNDTVVSREVLDDTEVDYLEGVLAASPSPWRVVMHHRTAWSSADVHGSAHDVRAAWVPTFERYGVDLVLAGHNHVYERTVPIFRDRRVAPGAGPTYVTTGGAGAPLYHGFDDDWFSAARAATEHYLLVDFGPTELRAVVRDLGGNTIDAFVLPR